MTEISLMDASSSKNTRFIDAKMVTPVTKSIAEDIISDAVAQLNTRQPGAAQIMSDPDPSHIAINFQDPGCILFFGFNLLNQLKEAQERDEVQATNASLKSTMELGV